MRSYIAQVSIFHLYATWADLFTIPSGIFMRKVWTFPQKFWFISGLLQNTTMLNHRLEYSPTSQCVISTKLRLDYFYKDAIYFLRILPKIGETVSIYTFIFCHLMTVCLPWWTVLTLYSHSRSWRSIKHFAISYWTHVIGHFPTFWVKKLFKIQNIYWRHMSTLILHQVMNSSNCLFFFTASRRYSDAL